MLSSGHCTLLWQTASLSSYFLPRPPSLTNHRRRRSCRHPHPNHRRHRQQRRQQQQQE